MWGEYRLPMECVGIDVACNGAIRDVHVKKLLIVVGQGLNH